MKKGNVAALLPIGVFLVLYLGLGILFEYGMGISMGFYNIPIVVIFLVALLVACFQNRSLSFDDKLVVMGRGIGDKTIVTMILIFMAAGVFVGTVGRDSAESVAYLMLSVIPAEYSVAVAAASGFSLPLCVASVMGGAMFGDNLSFISDTTIAACQGQGCQMKDKFRENFKIALPAALVTLVIILVLSLGTDISGTVQNDYNLLELIPYLIVLVGGIVGINVFIVLLLGILSGSIIVVAEGAVAATDLLGNMGTGAAGMFETTMVAVLVSAICALIRENGGFVALLNGIKRLFRSRKGGQLGMGLLVGAMDIATANNTVAIVMANPIAHEMAETYNVSRRKTASILDTFSCVFQGVIPYGAQMLVAISACTELGFQVSAFQIMPFLFYPFFLLISSLVFIFFVPDDRGYVPDHAAARMEATVGAAEGAAGDK